jgi:hypothetical protein
MPRVGFEPMIPACKRAKTVRALDHSVSVGVAPRNLNNGTKWKWSTLRTGKFTPEERALVPNG